MRLASLWLSIVAQLVLTAPVAAQDTETDEARVAFERGRTAYDAGDFEAALEAFQRAHALTGNAEILYNVGTVADRLRRDSLALEAYEGYLAAYPAAPDRAHVEARIAAIRAARVEPVVVVTPEPEPSTPEPAMPEPARPAPRPLPPPSNDAGYALLTTGAVLAVAGAALMITAAVETDAASRAETWAELRGPYERVPLESAVGLLSLGLGVAMGAIGAGWLIINGSASESVALRLGPAGASITGTF